METDDRISSLPDDILLHILSSIDTRYVVRTSVLSRRWRYVWRSMTTLVLTEPEINTGLWYADWFKTFVHKVFQSIDGSNMKKIAYENIGYQLDNKFLHDIVLDFSIRHKVQVLDITIYISEPWELPKSLFTCESLQVLKLKDAYGHLELLKLPSVVSLKNLQVLFLQLIRTAPDLIYNLVLIHCASLKNLTLVGCKGLGLLRIKSISLEKLRIEDYFHLNGTEQTVELYAPNLKRFEWGTSFSRDFVLKELVSISEIVLFGRFYDSTVNLPFGSLSAVLCGLNHARMLFIDVWGIKYEFDDWLSLYGKNKSECLLPNLTYMQIHIGVHKFQVPLVFLVLKNAPNIYHLVIELVGFIPKYDKKKLTGDHFMRKKQWQHTESASLLFNKLEVCKVNHFGGDKNASRLIKNLLQHSPSLKDFTIHLSPCLSREAAKAATRSKVIQELSELAKAFPSVQILINVD